MAEPNAASLFAIDGTHGHFVNTKAERGGLGQQVVGVAVALPKRVPSHRTKRSTIERHVAALRIAESYAQGAPREPRENVIAEPPPHRHLRPRQWPSEAIALDEVRATVEEGSEDGLKVCR